MELNPLTALSPLDGRYRKIGVKLAPYFSEFALIRYRIQVEIEWLKALAAHSSIREVSIFPPDVIASLDDVANTFTLADAKEVKAHEKVTNHDVKAVEYFLKDRLGQYSQIPRSSLEFIHFACTSEDITNLAHARMLYKA